MSLILALGPRGLTLHTPPAHVPVPAVHSLSTRAPQQFAVDAAHAAIFPTTDVLAAKSSKYDDILNSNTVNIDLGDILGGDAAGLSASDLKPTAPKAKKAKPKEEAAGFSFSTPSLKLPDAPKFEAPAVPKFDAP